MVKGGTRVRLDSYFLLKKNKLITLFLILLPRSFNFIKSSLTGASAVQTFFLYFKIQDIHFLSLFFKNSIFFKSAALSDISVTDFITTPRFKISYNLLSFFYKFRIFLTSFISETQFVKSIELIFKSST